MFSMRHLLGFTNFIDTDLGLWNVNFHIRWINAERDLPGPHRFSLPLKPQEGAEVTWEQLWEQDQYIR